VRVAITATTGKHFAIGMVTVGHWKGGTMDHEWLWVAHESQVISAIFNSVIQQFLQISL
jgi:hypothetical protein